jgi:hypothetical protein
MSYTIIRETKICKLDNGDVIHFSLQGCNNDTEGRERDDFHGKYYTADEWEAEVNKWESIPREFDGFDLKIGSRYCQWADYGKHLRTMTKRAMSFDDFKTRCGVYGNVYDGITYYPENGESVDYLPNSREEHDIVYGIMYGRIQGRYMNRRHIVRTQEEIVNTLKNKECVRFYIGKEHK